MSRTMAVVLSFAALTVLRAGTAVRGICAAAALVACAPMVFVRSAREFRSLYAGRCWLATAAFATLLSGCGGDGCPTVCFSDYDKPTTVAWQNEHYIIVTSPTGTEPVTLEAIVRVEAFYLVPSQSILIEPNALNQNPSPGTGIYPVVLDDNPQQGNAVVRFTVRIVSDAGSYPKGEFPFTATFKQGDAVVVAHTTVVVQ